MKNDTNDLFLQLYEPLHGRFVRYCSSRAFGIVETEDLVQEAVLAALRNFDRINDKGKLLGYLIGTVNNLLRQAQRRQRFQDEVGEGVLEKIQARTDDPEMALDIHFLLKAIAQLPEKQREALMLFEVSGFSIREIGEIQGDTDGTVKTRLSRSRQHLRKLLSEDARPANMAQRLSMFTAILF